MVPLPSIKKKFGFSLLELVIVIAIISVLITLSIPRFVKLQAHEELKTAALEMKSNLRLIQNNAIASVRKDEKSNLGCDNTANLEFWWIFFNSSAFNDRYYMAARCSTGSPPIFPIPPDTSLFAKNILIETIILDSSPTTTVWLIFRPVGGVIEFRDSLISPDRIETTATITLLHQNSNERYQVIINKAGNIYEKAL